MEVVGWLLGSDKEASKVVDHGGVRVDAWFELVLKRCLQVLSDLYYLFGGFMDYLWSRELDISNFGPADRKILPVSRDDKPIDIGTPCRETISFIYNLVRVSILFVALVGMKCADLESLVVSVPSGRTSNALSIPCRFSALMHLLQHLHFQDGSESHNRNLRAILTNGVVSCSTLSDQGYAEDFYDQ
ncbi:hypothetical protein Tco_1303403 [Tanacetum coccineum]